MKKRFCIIESNSSCALHYECWQEIIRQLESNGWKRVDKVRKSDIILVKQCCMTTEEMNNAMNELVKLSKEKIKGKVFLGECLSKNKDMLEAIMDKLPNLEFFQFTNPEEFFEQLGEKFEKGNSHTLTIVQNNTAIINISHGCSRKCTFCKVAYMHEPFQSVPFEEILEKVQIVRNQGIKKVVLNAMNSTAYNCQGKHLDDLLRAILKIPGIIYQLNGIVMAELTEEALEVLMDNRFVCIQMELQSLIPAVRDKMGIGVMTTEKILSILDKLKGKMIVSNIMTGFYGENNTKFHRQLEIIERNELFFLTANKLIPTPGTQASKLNNPSIKQAEERMFQLIQILSKIRRKVADRMIGHEQKGIVYAINNIGKAIVLCNNGVLVQTNMDNVEIGQEVTVVPRSIEKLFDVIEQSFILSTENADERKAKMLQAE